jgi:hypothetical protein
MIRTLSGRFATTCPSSKKKKGKKGAGIEIGKSGGTPPVEEVAAGAGNVFLLPVAVG